MTYPDSPQVVVGTRTLMIALTELEQSPQAGRLPEVAAGLAAYARAGTQLRPEPPFTVVMVPGLARGTSNSSP
jgi:hypothetical protein